MNDASPCLVIEGNTFICLLGFANDGDSQDSQREIDPTNFQRFTTFLGLLQMLSQSWAKLCVSDQTIKKLETLISPSAHSEKDICPFFSPFRWGQIFAAWWPCQGSILSLCECAHIDCVLTEPDPPTFVPQLDGHGLNRKDLTETLSILAVLNSQSSVRDNRLIANRDLVSGKQTITAQFRVADIEYSHPIAGHIQLPEQINATIPISNDWLIALVDSISINGDNFDNAYDFVKRVVDDPGLRERVGIDRIWPLAEIFFANAKDAKQMTKALKMVFYLNAQDSRLCSAAECKAFSSCDDNEHFHITIGKCFIKQRDSVPMTDLLIAIVQTNFDLKRQGAPHTLNTTQTGPQISRKRSCRATNTICDRNPSIKDLAWRRKISRSARLHYWAYGDGKGFELDSIVVKHVKNANNNPDSMFDNDPRPIDGCDNKCR